MMERFTKIVFLNEAHLNSVRGYEGYLTMKFRLVRQQGELVGAMQLRKKISK